MTVHPSATLHPTAIVEDGATIGEGCRIGPYSMVGPEVTLAEGVELISHAVVTGVTRIGARTRIWPFASVGHQPQDLKYGGERTELIIGADNMIRESSSFSPGTEGGGGVTRIGDNNLFMLGTHVGHDCDVGSNCVLANNAGLAGHSQIADGVIFGGQSASHQFTRVGKGAFIGACVMARKDVIPYGMLVGDGTRLGGLNIVGLKRRGVEKAGLHEIRAAYREIFLSEEGTLIDRARSVHQGMPGNPFVQEITSFLLADTSRSYAIP